HTHKPARHFKGSDTETRPYASSSSVVKASDASLSLDSLYNSTPCANSAAWASVSVAGADMPGVRATKGFGVSNLANAFMGEHFRVTGRAYAAGALYATADAFSKDSNNPLLLAFSKSACARVCGSDGSCTDTREGSTQVTHAYNCLTHPRSRP